MSIPSIGNISSLDDYHTQLNQAIKSAKPKKVEQLLKFATEKLQKKEENLVDTKNLQNLFSLNKQWIKSPENMTEICSYLINTTNINTFINNRPLLTFVIENILSSKEDVTLNPLMDLLLSKGINVNELLENKQTTLEYLSSDDLKEKYKSVNPYLLETIKALLIVYGKSSSLKEESKIKPEDLILMQMQEIMTSKEAKLHDFCLLITTLKLLHDQACGEFVNKFEKKILYKDPISKANVNLFMRISLDNMRGGTNKLAFIAITHLLLAYGLTPPTLTEYQSIILLERS